MLSKNHLVTFLSIMRSIHTAFLCPVCLYLGVWLHILFLTHQVTHGAISLLALTKKNVEIQPRCDPLEILFVRRKYSINKR